MHLRLEPRDWQKEALAAWVNRGSRGVAEVVTGGGKTVFAELCMADVLRRRPDTRIVVVVPTQALLDQWFVSLQDELQVPASDINAWSGNSKVGRPRTFNLMVINTAREAAPRLAARHPVMLVVDECHRAGSPANARSLEGEHVATLGLSATPWREYDDAFERLISPALGPIVFTYGVDDAARDGILAPFDLVNVGVDLLPDEAREYEKLTSRIRRAARMSNGAEEADEHLKQLLMKRAKVSARASMRVPVAVRIIDGHRGARAMVFHEEVEPAEAILTRLRERGHSATIYHSRIPPLVRRDNLRLFRAGLFDVLVSCRALDEGVNIPETQVAVIAAATASERQRIQRLGRVLRPARGKLSARIYTLYATEVEEGRLLAEAERLESVRSVEWQRVAIKRG